MSDLAVRPAEPSTGGHLGTEATLDRLLVAQALRTPDAVAVRQWDTALTYRDLLDAAAVLGARLRAEGAGPETAVGVCTRRAPSMVVAVLGVLLSGAAYVPLDAGHPTQRLVAILDDAQASLAVTDKAGSELLAGAGRTLIPVTSSAPPGQTPPASVSRPENAAYVMYTSGSTGRPKGVVVSHRNVIAYLKVAFECFGIDASCRSIGFASLGFDASVGDIFVPLACGGSVQLIGEEDRIDPARLQRFLEVHRVTWGYIPPAVLPLLDPARLPDLADVVSAGEPAPPEQVARWSQPGRCRFHNWYGPTETTVSVTGDEFTGAWDRPLPIGRPLPAVSGYVLDERMRPCPPGVAGELCIGGLQVTRGYLRLPARTAEVFVPDPVSGAVGGRLYRTGDRVMWRPDGALAYLGRMDRQVKINGQRVEIGEIEAVLDAHPRIRQVAVDVSATAGGVKQLVAYLAPADAPDHREVRRHCSQRLPAFMIPTRVIRVAALPLTVAGKVDMRALRQLSATEVPPPAAAGGTASPAAASPAAAPGWSVEAVTRAWSEVFEAAPPHPEAGFFASGGQSILAMRLVATLSAWTGRQVAVEDVFDGQTVAGLAQRLAAALPVTEQRAIPSSSPPELSPAQRRIWFVEQIAPGTAAHNIALAQRLRGGLDVAALRQALRWTAERQEVLRWRIHQRDGIPTVTVAPPQDVALPCDDLTGLPADGRDTALRELLDTEAGTPFDLAAGPLWRARLIRLGPGDHVLAITAHHVVFDGTSIPVLFRDLARSYQGTEPEPLSATFADYVQWLNGRAAARSGDGHWWAHHLQGVHTVLDLPRDRPRPLAQTFHGASVAAQVDPATATLLRELSAGAGATLFAALLAAFGHLAYRLTGLDDLVIGTPLADRRDLAFDQVVGLLLHIVPLRLRPGGDASLATLIRACHDEATSAFAHADVPFERIVESVGGPRDTSRNPLIQILFNMYGFTADGIQLAGLAAEAVAPGLPGSLFDLTLYVNEEGGGALELSVVYNPDLYDAARIDALLASYVHLLDECARQPGRPMREISLRPEGSGLPRWATALPRWDGAGIVERIRAAAQASPDQVAVSGPGGPLRYRDVEAIQARTMAAVRDSGAAPGDAVAVLATRDCRLPAVLLGVLSAGARWMIADPELPGQVLVRQVAAVRPRAVVRLEPDVTCPAALAGLPVVTAGPSAAPRPAGHGPDPQPLSPHPDIPASDRGYFLLTSGSTGEPKVVLTPERPLAHFAEWYQAVFGLGPADRFALLSGLAHDPVLRDMFMPLVLGARLCVPAPELLRDPAQLRAWLRDEQITVAHLTPQLVRLLALAPAASEDPPMALRLAVLAGDQGSAADVTALRAMAPSARVVNFYGTTETPQAHAWHEPAPDMPDDTLPAGHGIDGAVLLVLGPGGQPAAVGELGEVTIRSRYLAAGYSDPDLTGRRFGLTAGSDPEDRFFRTGDLGRYRPDGAVVLAGRADGQVKIRGFRVETGEVQAALAALPGVRQAYVAATGSGQDRRLIACAVPAEPTVSAVGLRSGLERVLPGYAVPADITLLPRLPLTPNGKVDHAAVANAARPGMAPQPAAGGALAGRAEHIIAGVWREVLGLPAVGPSDNFFDIGGHSLAVAAVAAKLGERMDRQVTVLELFRYPTIRELATHLDGQDGDPVLNRAAHRAAQRRRARSSPVPRAVEGGNP